MTADILTAAGVKNRQGRFLRMPAETYAVYFDDKTVDAADRVTTDGRLPRIVTHDVTIEVYEPSPDDKAEAAIGSAEAEARRILSDAMKTAETKKREALLEAKDEIHRLRSDADKELRERRSEVQRAEHRLQQKEESLEHKIENLEIKEEKIAKRAKEVELKLEEVEQVKKSSSKKLKPSRRASLICWRGSPASLQSRPRAICLVCWKTS